MRKFYQNKLWREKLVKIREKNGAIVHLIPLAHAEYGEELNMKLLEEANEIYTADTHKEMVNEIADVLEAIDCILNFHGISKEEVLRHKEAKLLEFGSYTAHQLVDYAEFPAGSEEEQHCLNNPDRYPELYDEDLEDDENDESPINKCCQ